MAAYPSNEDLEDDPRPPKETRDFVYKVIDSCIRVTLASFGGALAGYGVGARREEMRVQGFTNAQTKLALPDRSLSPSTRMELSTKTHARQAPPMKPQDLPSPKKILARSWGMSCFLFAFLLETSRIASPTTVLFKEMDMLTLRGEDDVERLMLRKGLAAVGDYALGGTLAGISGARAWTTGYARVLPSLLRGAFYGTLLGIAGGLVQAGIDVIEVMEEHQPESPESKEPPGYMMT